MSRASGLRRGALTLLLLAPAAIANAQALTVTSLSPTRNAPAAPRVTNVAATFSQPLSNSAATLGSVKVFSQQAGGQKAGTATVSGNTLSFNPSSDFKAGETVFATLTAAAQNSGGISLAKPQVFQFTAATAPSSGSFGAGSEITATANGGRDIGDVDGDGDLDLLVVDGPGTISGTGTVQTLVNNGTGAFTAGPTSLLPGSSPNSVVLGDLDGDGDLDFVTSNAYSAGTSRGGSISMGFNNGQGTFTSTGGGAGERTYRSVALGDVDADGDLDILATSNRELGGGSYLGPGLVTVLLNSGSGTFTAGQQVEMPQGINQVSVGDLDNDGDLDLLASDGTTTHLRLNDGTGTFSGSATVNVSGGHLALGDLDNDGDLDLVSTNGSLQVSIGLNNGGATFTIRQFTSVLFSSSSISLGDVDGDGDVDFTAGSSSGTLVWVNDGTALFRDLRLASVREGLLSDMDGDNDLDLIGTTSAGTLGVRLNQNTPPDPLAITALSPGRNAPAAPRTSNVAATFSQPLSTNTSVLGALKVFSQQAGGKKAGTAMVSGTMLSFNPSSDFKAGETVFATLTNAVQSSGGTGLAKPQVFQFTAAATPSTGTFVNSTEVPIGAANGDLAVGDIDGDGDLDLLKIGGGDGATTVSVRRNNGTGAFSGNQEIPVSAFTNSIVLGDLDSDGDLDFVASSTTYLNNGQGTFSAGSDFEVTGLTGTSLYDMDADGDLDLLFTQGNGIVVRLNDGTGTFSTSTSFNTTVRGITGYTAGDIDNDGDIDVLFGIQQTGGATGIALNNGNATFSLGATGITSRLLVPYRARLEDVDNDGDLDLLNPGSGAVEVLLNNGAGSFSPGSVVDGGGANIPALATGDIDGDGDLDLLIESSTVQGAYIRLNNGDGTFGGNTSIPFATTQAPLKLADIDGDGDLDLLGGTSTGVAVHLNQNAATALSVTALSPTRNALTAPRNTNVAVTFNQALTNSAGTLGSLKVFSQQAGGLKASSVTVSGNTLTANPNADFKPGETVFATLTTAAQSSNGASLAKPQVYQFTTATSPSAGTFSGGSNPTVSNSTPSLRDVTLGDVDGDGDLDLLTANFTNYFNPGSVSVRLNDGTGAFGSSQEVPVGSRSLALALGDVDGDGDLDFVTANGVSPTASGVVNVRLNNSSGSFSGTQQVAVSGEPVDVRLADVDGDGDLDLLSVSSGISTASIRLNDGLGNFGGGSNVAVGLNPNQVAVADVDNDGDLDLLTMNSNGSSVSVRLNDGLGSFSGSQEVAVANYPRYLATGDVDGDGDLDLLVARYGDDRNGQVDVFLNNGSGSFNSTQSVPVGPGASVVKLGDIDGDGDLDLLVGNLYDETGVANNQVSVRLNNGSGSFSGDQQVTVTYYPGSLALGDVDGDGDLDLATANNNGPELSIRLNQNAGGLLAVTALSPARNSVAAPRTASVTATFNQALTNNAATLGSLKVFSQQAGGLKASSVTVSGNTLTANPNADFKPGETVFATLTTAAQSSNGTGLAKPQVFQFTTATAPAPGSFAGGSDPAVGDSPRSVAVGDVDGDGDLDLLTANDPSTFPGTATVSVRLNNGAGSYSGGSEVLVGNGPGGIPPLTEPRSIVLADVDSDGDLDFLTANDRASTVSIRFNNGSGVFSGTYELQTLGNAYAIAVGDVDGDGDLDLLVTNTSSSSNTISVFLNNGSGVFGTGSEVIVNVQPIDVVLGDVDNDGDLDLIAVFNLGNNASVRLNNGAGIFSGGSEIAIGSSPYRVAAGDVDGDGDLDFVTANTNNNTVSVRFNNGSGTFSGTTSIAVGNAPSKVILSDVDGDGDLDLLTANATNNTVSVRRNNGSGTFSNSQEVAVGATPFDVITGDVDNDGDVDLLTANNTDQTVSIRLNQTLAAPTITSISPAIAPVGSTVVINGTNFLNTTSVTFNGVAATGFVVNGLGTQITVTVPAGATSGPVVVTTATGVSSGFQFTVGPLLTITNLAPSRNAVAAPRNTSVAVTLSQQPSSSPATLNGITVFSQQAQGKKAGTGIVSGNTLLFDLTTDFKAGETVFATITTAVQNSAGTQNLLVPQVFQFTTATAPSPGTFSGGSDPSVGNGPVNVASGDVDGDGDLDLITTNLGNPSGPAGLGNGTTATVRLNTGNGTFTSAQQLTVGRGPAQAVLADVDNDGDLDLLTANSSTADVSLRFNNGSGTFDNGYQVGSGNIHGIAVGDVNGDGYQDLLIADYNEPSTVTVGLNNTMGTFPLFNFDYTQRVSVGSRPLNIALGDVDNDGDLDFVTASSNGATASVRLNNGLGSFSGTQEVAVGFNPMSVVLGDVDKDGDLDIVTANYYDYTNPADNFTNSTASVRLNNGSGTFSGTQNVAIGRGARQAVLGDVDGDGDLDLVATNELTNAASVRLNNGSGTFSGTQQVAVGNSPNNLVLTDLDGDGDLDLATANFLGNTVSVRLNQGAAGPLVVTAVSPTRNTVAAPRTTPVTFTFSQSLGSDPETEQAIRVFGTQSGRKFGSNIVSGNTLRLAPAVSFKPGETVFATATQAVRSNGGATLASPHVFQFTAAAAPSNGVFGGGSDPTVGTNPYGVAAGDIDGDGDQDLVTANINSNTVSVRFNNGSGSFSGTQEVSVGRGPSQVVLGDVDADGDLDLVTANSRTIFPGTVSVRLNNGAGIFSGSTEVAVGDTPHAVAFGDVDGDGDLDLLAANYTAGSNTTNSTVSVRLNNGLGSFTSGASEVSVGTRPLSIAVGDVDNDGDLDFVTANSNTTTASVRLNNGMGSFSGSTEVQVEFNPESIVLGDVDGDGDLDFATANRASNVASVCINNGSGSFTSTQLLAVGNSPHGVALSDIDGDGDLDLATANTGSNSVSVRRNLGNGNFQGNQEVNVGAGPFSLAFADMDSNGTLDLLTANSGTNSASVRLSSAAATATAKVLAAAPARLSEQVSLYPNPARTRVQVQLPAELARQSTQVQLLNTLGQVVLEQKLAAQPTAELLLPALPAGVYTLRFGTGQGIISKRLMIE
ncbi:FG-GAP-like repeat-containing protein [Hymenobacter cavernae]|uniref:T9SS C-terminal target domain-containing protein n=1 Tax=Hymenobacter cavernae TaxID=2044852 RepID=A0ABQ1U7D2_9BACT|nr:FG-GAP-like repeat-containing protein [Hymenobacter cavernae]GGF10995.1 hypothetical protein GCM10011383_22740 [Hymenobacter cavernae]